MRSRAGRDAKSIGMYLAAAYNCGAGRVEESARVCRGQWTCHLPEETRIYLEEIRRCLEPEECARPIEHPVSYDRKHFRYFYYFFSCRPAGQFPPPIRKV